MSDESVKIWKGQLEEVGSLRRRFEPLSSEAVKDEWKVGFSRTVEEPSRKDREVGAWHTRWVSAPGWAADRQGCWRKLKKKIKKNNLLRARSSDFWFSTIWIRTAGKEGLTQTYFVQ